VINLNLFFIQSFMKCVTKKRKARLSGGSLLEVFADTHEFVLFIVSLESTVTKLGRGIDEFELNLLEGVSAGLGQKALSDGEDSLLGSNNTTLEHNPVLSDNTVMREASQRSDGLLGEVEFGGGALDVSGFSDSVDLLVHLGSVMVTTLTSSRNGELDTRWMP